MGAPPIRLIQFPGGIAVCVCPPSHLFQISDELPAAGVDQQAVLTQLVLERAIHTVGAVPNRRVLARNLMPDPKPPIVTAQEILDNLPVGARGRAVTIISRGVAIEPERVGSIQRPVLYTVSYTHLTLPT